MKAHLIITGNIRQIVLQPEGNAEAALLDLIHEDGQTVTFRRRKWDGDGFGATYSLYQDRDCERDTVIRLVPAVKEGP